MTDYALERGVTATRAPRRAGVCVLTCLVVLLIAAAPVGAAPHLGLRYPALSPDGKQIAFAYHGDLWLAPADGGVARRLTLHVGTEARPVWTPDGQSIVYTADHHGQNDVYIVRTDGTGRRRLTFSAANDFATGVSRDGRRVIFHSNRANVTTLYTVPVAGGRVDRLLPGYWTIVGHGAFARTSDDLLMTTSYESLFFPWRKGYRGSHSADIWRRRANGSLERLLGGAENELWPMWGAGDKAIYYVSDRQYKTYNIWRLSNRRSELVTRFRKGHVRWPSIGAGGTVIVFERQFRLWRLDLATGRSRALSFNMIVADKKSPVDRYGVNGTISEFSVSPDGKKVALVAKGQLWITSKTGGVSRRLTTRVQRCMHLNWSKDSRRVAYISDRDGLAALYIADANGSTPPRKLKSANEPLYQPQFSPDGKRISYMKGKLELRVIGASGSGDRLIVKDLLGGHFASGYDWSPDGRWIVYTQNRGFSGEVILHEIGGQRRINLTRNGFSDVNPRFTRDGRQVYFSANRTGHKWPHRTGNYDVYLLSLQRRNETFDEDAFDRLFATSKRRKAKKKSAKTTKKSAPLRIDTFEIERRISKIAHSRGDDRMAEQSPKNAKLYVFTSNALGRNELYRTVLDKKGKGSAPVQISRGLSVRGFAFLPDGKSVLALSGGHLYSIGVFSKSQKRLAVSGSMVFSRQARFAQMFNEVWQTMAHYFYDKTLHGVNWRALRRQVEPVIRHLKTMEEFVHVTNEMLGFLNSSHTGIRAGLSSKNRQPAGVLGLVFAPNSYRVASIVRGGPLANATTDDLTGWELSSVDGVTLSERVNVTQLLQGKIGRRVVLVFKRGTQSREVKVRPAHYLLVRRLLYRDWERQRLEMVHKKASGRVGYVHLVAMGHGDYLKFNRALEHELSDKDAAIIDLRFNHGGNVHDLVLALIKKQQYATWRIRGMNSMPQPFHAIGHKPIVLLINEVTLSDGEMTAAGFKALKLGTIIGNTTYGWLIFTTAVRTLWGAQFRLPFWGCYGLDGQDLERHGGVTPDIRVINSIADRVAGRDPQLQRAIDFLRQRLRRKQ